MKFRWSIRRLDKYKNGDRLLLDDGSWNSSHHFQGERRGEVIHGGVLLPHKGMNFPDSSFPFVFEKN